MTPADELRAETSRIVTELLRISNRYDGADWAGIRPSDAASAAGVIKTLQSHVCTCSQARGFEIPVHRTDARSYRAMEQAKIDRMLFEDRAAGWEGPA